MWDVTCDTSVCGKGDSFVCGVCGVTHLYVECDSFVCGVTHLYVGCVV